MEGAQSVFHPFRLLTHTHQSVVAQGDAKITYILSEAARGIIKENHCNGMFSGREDATDPPYMAPSTNPEDYSKVGMIQHFWVGNAYDTMAQSGAQHASIRRNPCALCWVLCWALRHLKCFRSGLYSLAFSHPQQYLCVLLPMVR